jgi:hypothetical protein
MIIHNLFTVVHLLQLSKFMVVAAGPQNRAGLPEIFGCHLYRQCPCQGPGQKGAWINPLKRNGNYGQSENITHGLPGCSCQDFLQTVKPVGGRFKQNKLEGYPAIHFRL